MIPRYTRKEMGNLWGDERKFRGWLDIEGAVLLAKEKLGFIPAGISRNIQRISINVKRIGEIEETTGHDVMAFLKFVSEQMLQKGLNQVAQYFHVALTSCDITDTGLSILLRDSLVILEKDLTNLLVRIGQLAKTHQETIEIGRTHGIHAEPITFGFKLANWYDELERHLERLQRLRKLVSVGKISGAVGTYAFLDPKIEEVTCELLGLTPCRISTQIICRDRHAEYVSVLALIAGSLEKFATEIRNLQRTEIGEVSEPFKPGQKGSSAMPHKRNPVSGENVCSLARMIRGYVIPALENQLTWHERDLANSANERIILADSSTLLDFMLARFTKLMDGLSVNREKMEENLEITKGAIFSEKVMVALAGKGLPREEAHDLVQELALKAIRDGAEFSNILSSDNRITDLLCQKEILDCFDPRQYLGNIGKIFQRFDFISSNK